MVRKLKHHESKLLKKVDMHHFKRESTLREISVMRRYHVQDRDDYRKYNKIVGETMHNSGKATNFIFATAALSADDARRRRERFFKAFESGWTITELQYDLQWPARP